MTNVLKKPKFIHVNRKKLFGSNYKSLDFRLSRCQLTLSHETNDFPINEKPLEFFNTEWQKSGVFEPVAIKSYGMQISLFNKLFKVIFFVTRDLKPSEMNIPSNNFV